MEKGGSFEARLGKKRTNGGQCPEAVMYQKDALVKAAEKRHQVSAGPWGMGVSGGGTWDLESWSRGGLDWAEECCPPAGTIPGSSDPAVGSMCWRSSQGLEMSYHEAAAKTWLLAMASPGETGVERGSSCWAASRALPSFQD